MTAATTRPFRNLVGGELVEGVDGAAREVRSPATGEVIAEVPDGSMADVERAMAAAREARIPWRDTTPGQRMEALLGLAALVERHSDELAELESLNVGKPMSLRQRGAADLRRRAALLRGRGADAQRPGGGRVRRRLHVLRPARADRDRRADHAVELPADDGDLEDRAGARGGQRRRAQAVRADAADDAAPRRARGRGPAARGAQRHHGRRRPGRRGHRHARRRRDGVAHRQRRDRQVDRAQRRRHAQARPPRARRQGARGRPRRRRPGRRRGGPAGRELPQLGPGLHGGVARARRAPRSTTGCSRSSSRRPSRSSSATRPRATRSRWAR